MRRISLALIAVCSVVVLGSACGGSQGAASARPQRQALRVKVTTVLVQEVIYQIKALGSLEAEEMVQVTAEVEGAVRRGALPRR